MIKQIMLMKMMMAFLSACGGGANGESGGSVVSGSARFINFASSSTQNNRCLNYSAPSNQDQCENIGGAWNTSNQNTYTTTVGSVDESFNTTCSSGTATSIVCRLGAVDYVPTVGLNMSSHGACVNIGGTIEVTCSTLSGVQSVGACSGYDPHTALNCSELGGTFYLTLKSVTGDIQTDSVMNFVAGNNIIQVITDSQVDAVDVMAMSPQAPVSLSYTIKIKDWANVVFWTSNQNRTTGNAFDEANGYPAFSVISPAATSSSQNGSVVVESATLYFY